MRWQIAATLLFLSGCALAHEDPAGAGGGGGAQPVECVEPDDCPGPNWRCERRTCIDGVCGTEFAPDGTPDLSDGFPGDCAILVCDGKGRSRREFQRHDAPDDGKECTVTTCEDDYVWTTTVRTGLDCVIRHPDDTIDIGTCSDTGDCESK